MRRILTIKEKVDPRVCGGALETTLSKAIALGRSPRMRGSLEEVKNLSSYFRSIPAYAGEPLLAMRAGQSKWVDPRVCGGAHDLANTEQKNEGRSPRMRGSLWETTLIFSKTGSIPAYAGEPCSVKMYVFPSWVDPRVCGGAIDSIKIIPHFPGRSPRMRGSLIILIFLLYHLGSIPAYAGEPLSGHGVKKVSGVDPRVCGGA